MKIPNRKLSHLIHNRQGERTWYTIIGEQELIEVPGDLLRSATDLETTANYATLTLPLSYGSLTLYYFGKHDRQDLFYFSRFNHHLKF